MLFVREFVDVNLCVLDLTKPVGQVNLYCVYFVLAMK